MDVVRKQDWWLILLKGIVLLLLSFLVFANPVSTLLGISLFIGIGILITGVIIVVVAVNGKKELEHWKWKLVEGVLDIFLGFMLVANPQITAVVLPFMLAFWIVFYGILLTVGAFNQKKFNWGLLILGVLTVILGNIVMFDPLLLGLTISIWIGLALLSAGIYNIMFSLDVKKLKNEVEAVGN